MRLLSEACVSVTASPQEGRMNEQPEAIFDVAQLGIPRTVRQYLNVSILEHEMNRARPCRR